MKQKNIQIIGLQPAQARVGAGQNIVPAPVKLPAVEMQAALALQVYVLPFQAGQREGVAETGFRFPVIAITSGMIKEIDAFIRRGADHVRRGLHGQRGHAHTAENDPGRVPGTVHNIDRFHICSPFPVFACGQI